MSSTNKTTYYELSQYIGTDKPTYLSDYNGDMLKIDTGIHDAATDASTALTTANSAASTASDAATAASTATTTANSASATALEAKTTAETASTNAAAALAAAADAEEAAEANTIENLAPAYDPTLTYEVGDLVTYIDSQGSGKLYECIIEVSTPEAFNINKWDDKTTSEVFSRKMELLGQIVSDGVKTYATLIKEACDLIPNTGFVANTKYEIIMKTTVDFAIFEPSAEAVVNPYDKHFVCVKEQFFSNGNYEENIQFIGVNSNGEGYYGSHNMNLNASDLPFNGTPTVRVSNSSATVPNENARTFVVVKINL